MTEPSGERGGGADTGDTGPLRLAAVLGVVLGVALVIGGLMTWFSRHRPGESGWAGRIGLAMAALWLALGLLARLERARKSVRVWNDAGQMALLWSLAPTIWIAIVSVNAKVRYLYTHDAIVSLDGTKEPPMFPWITLALAAVSFGWALWSLRDPLARRTAWGWIPLLVPLTQTPFLLGVKSLPW